MIQLKTKLKVTVDGEPLPEPYTATVDYKGGKAIVTIQETWRYYLETLLGLDNFSNPVGDHLYTDFGKEHCVSGMKALLKEIINIEK